MRRRIVKLERAVAGAGQNLTRCAHDHRADRDLAAIARRFGLRERKVHGRGLLASKRPICKLRVHGAEIGP